MSNAKHTPGPWIQGDGTENNLKTDVYINECCVDLEGSGRTMSGSEANARLISAAPEMLSALYSLPQYDVTDCPFCDVNSWRGVDHETLCPVRLVRDAIRKATGGDHE